MLCKDLRCSPAVKKPPDCSLGDPPFPPCPPLSVATRSLGDGDEGVGDRAWVTRGSRDRPGADVGSSPRASLLARPAVRSLRCPLPSPAGNQLLELPGRQARGPRALASPRRCRPAPGPAGQCEGLCVCPQHSARLKKEEEPVQNPWRKRRENLNMEKLYNENEGQLEIKGKPEDEVESEDEGKSDEEEKLEVEGKPEHAGKFQNEGQPDDKGQPEDEGKQEKQGKSENEGKPHSEGKPESLATAESESRAAEKPREINLVVMTTDTVL
ncbi:sarcalumenin-like [Suricata suricatta]|uniref:sarcalumenin-like n=1 Tax=Suricata suricatta TaxID=37032 RepID=UPI001155DFFA|nr:sarcalumenin-like [Suricata suricatta]